MRRRLRKRDDGGGIGPVHGGGAVTARRSRGKRCRREVPSPLSLRRVSSRGSLSDRGISESSAPLNRDTLRGRGVPARDDASNRHLAACDRAAWRCSPHETCRRATLSSRKNFSRPKCPHIPLDIKAGRGFPRSEISSGTTSCFCRSGARLTLSPKLALVVAHHRGYGGPRRASSDGQRWVSFRRRRKCCRPRWIGVNRWPSTDGSTSRCSRKTCARC